MLDGEHSLDDQERDELSHLEHIVNDISDKRLSITGRAMIELERFALIKEQQIAAFPSRPLRFKAAELWGCLMSQTSTGYTEGYDIFNRVK